MTRFARSVDEIPTGSVLVDADGSVWVRRWTGTLRQRWRGRHGAGTPMFPLHVVALGLPAGILEDVIGAATARSALERADPTLYRRVMTRRTAVLCDKRGESIDGTYGLRALAT